MHKILHIKMIKVNERNISMLPAEVVHGATSDVGSANPFSAGGRPSFVDQLVGVRRRWLAAAAASEGEAGSCGLAISRRVALRGVRWLRVSVIRYLRRVPPRNPRRPRASPCAGSTGCLASNWCAATRLTTRGSRSNQQPRRSSTRMAGRPARSSACTSAS